MSSNAVIGNDNKMVIPKYIAFKTIGEEPPKYLCTGYHKDMGLLSCSTLSVLDPLAKFQMVPVKIRHDYFYHIRSCSLNRYWSEHATRHGYVGATSEQPVTDEKSSKCTLFSVQVEGTTAKISAVRSCQIGLINTSDGDKVLSTGSARDVKEVEFTMVDVESIIVLPRYISFKGQNEKYVMVSEKDVIVNCLLGPGNFTHTRTVEFHKNLHFGADDTRSKAAVYQVTNTDDGLVRIMSVETGKYLHVRRRTLWVEADVRDGDAVSRDTEYIPRPIDYLFEVIPADKDNQNIIALKSKATGKFCTSKDGDFRRYECLWAGADTPDKYAKLEIVEPVDKRTVNIMEFRLNNAITTDTNQKTVDSMGYSNTSGIEQEKKLEKTLKDSKTSSWNTSTTTTSSVSFNLNAGIPDKLSVGFGITSEYSKEYQWGKGIETSEEITGGGPIKVPVGKRVEAELIATKYTFEVPFTYSQTDFLSTGDRLDYPPQDGVYSGVSGYHFEIKTTFKPI